jgi:hypothetical protein
MPNHTLTGFDARIRAMLACHAIAVIVLGLLAGVPFGMVITGGLEGDVRAWRMAHLEGVMNGLLMLAIAAAGSLLQLGPREARWLPRCLLVTGYGNVVASIIGACVGARGLDPTASSAELVVFLLFWMAILAVFAALFIAARGALRFARSQSDSA